MLQTTFLSGKFAAAICIAPHDAAHRHLNLAGGDSPAVRTTTLLMLRADGLRSSQCAVRTHTNTNLAQARDEDGNRRLSGGDDFVVELRGGPPAAFGAVADMGDGTYAVTYSTERAGEYLFHVSTGAWSGVDQGRKQIRTRPTAQVHGQEPKFDLESHDLVESHHRPVLATALPM